MTKIAVVSDTHVPEYGNLPSTLLKALEKMDAIIHLGDFSNTQTYMDFQRAAPVVAVFGNCDCDELKTQLPEKKKIEIDGFTLGLVHGWGPRKNLEKRVAQVFTEVDIVLFGHSHYPLWAIIDNITVFNPGSISMNIQGPGSYGILELGETIEHRFVLLD